jgi:hypothetical protein
MLVLTTVQHTTIENSVRATGGIELLYRSYVDKSMADPTAAIPTESVRLQLLCCQIPRYQTLRCQRRYADDASAFRQVWAKQKVN